MEAQPVRIFIMCRGYGARGPRYRVRLNKPDGMIIIESTTEPLFASARFLLSKGIKGKIEMWDDTQAFCRMSGNIEGLARMTVSEGQHGITLRKYAEQPASGKSEEQPTKEARAEICRPRSVRHGSRATGGLDVPNQLELFGTPVTGK